MRVVQLGKAQRPAGRFTGVVDADSGPADDRPLADRFASTQAELPPIERSAVHVGADAERLTIFSIIHERKNGRKPSMLK